VFWYEIAFGLCSMAGCGVWGVGLWVQGFGCGVWDVGCEVCGVGCGVPGVAIGVWTTYIRGYRVGIYAHLPRENGVWQLPPDWTFTVTSAGALVLLLPSEDGKDFNVFRVWTWKLKLQSSLDCAEVARYRCVPMLRISGSKMEVVGTFASSSREKR
jgi:hypothetical protein